MIAPDFTLPDEVGTKHSLRNYRDRWVVVYFYPKDDTPGCTKEACSFRDQLSVLTDEGVTVLGISKDSIKSHYKFKSKYNLNFPLLSDSDGQVAKAYGALGTKKMFGKEYQGVLRQTFLINPDGEIVKKYPKVKPAEHAEEILADLKNLKS